MSESLEPNERLPEGKPPERMESVDRALRSVSELDSRKRLENARLDRMEPLARDSANKVHIAYLENGERAFFKPQNGEDPQLRMLSIPPYQLSRREVAACDIDRAIGVGLVPDTVERQDLEHGPGSLQVEVRDPGMPPGSYSELDRQELGAFDYLIANTDRHKDNYLTQESGRPAAIDNGASFPENDLDAIKSPFVNEQLGKPLDPRIVEKYRYADERELNSLLRQRGISEGAIAGFNARLQEIRAGRITGEAWGGRLLDEDWNVVRERPSKERDE